MKAFEHRILAAVNDAVILERPIHAIVEITGNDALDLLHRLSTNDLVHVKSGHCQCTVFPTDKGRIVDYVYVVRVQHRLFMLTSIGRDKLLIDWIGKYTIMEDIQLDVATSTMSMVSVVGPNALTYANTLLGLSLSPWSCCESTLPGGGKAIVLCTKDFDTISVHIVARRSEHTSIDSLAEEFCSRHNVNTISQEDFDTFRIMRGIPFAHHELREEFNPFEAGLAHAISFTKGCYIGQEVIARLDTYQKVQRQLVGLLMSAIPKEVRLIPLVHSGNEVGWLTSASPATFEGGTQLGLGIIRKEVQPGDVLSMGDEGRILQATVSSIPFRWPKAV